MTLLLFFKLNMLKHFSWNNCSLSHVKHTPWSVVTFVHLSTGSSLLEQTGLMGEFQLWSLSALSCSALPLPSPHMVVIPSCCTHAGLFFSLQWGVTVPAVLLLQYSQMSTCCHSISRDRKAGICVLPRSVHLIFSDVCLNGSLEVIPQRLY